MLDPRRIPALTGQAKIDYAALIQRNANQITATPAPTALQPGNFIDSEVPTGTIDGVNEVFVLANTPVAGTLMVYKDGARATDFTLVDATITFVAAPVTSVLCDYRI